MNTTPALKTPAPQHVKALRTFNRFYTQRIGVLAPYLGSQFTLTEVRAMYELAHQAPGSDPAVAPIGALTASALAATLGLDAGYLSRILRRFEQQQWLTRRPAPGDARQSLLQLTPLGYEVFAPLQQQSRDDAASLLMTLPERQHASVINAMQTLERLLQPAATSPTPTATSTATASTATKAPFTLREPQPGDMGWVVQQHAQVYAREYGWNSEFEALVAEIVAKYLRNPEPQWERCWIAEIAGEMESERVGAVFVVRKSKTVAQLRMLILTPAARGLGLGGRLTDECIAFARSKGYKKMQLWTNSCLIAARGLYAKRGFKLVKSQAYEGFGQSLVGEIWELRL